MLETPRLSSEGTKKHLNILKKSGRLFWVLENNLAILTLSAMVIFAIFNATSRTLFHYSFVGVMEYLQHGTLWITFIGAALAAKRGRHLKFAFKLSFLPSWMAKFIQSFGTSFTIIITGILCVASILLVTIEKQSPTKMAPFLVSWVAQLPMPIFFGAMALHLLKRSEKSLFNLLFLVLAAAGVILLQHIPFGERHFSLIPVICLFAIAAISGAPLFVFFGGIPLFLFYLQGTSIAAIPSETYSMVASPNLPTIPFFILTGCILAMGGASHRLVNLFKALFGALPGGIPIAAILACAFFTTFSGASGVTILALGGVLYPILITTKYPSRFSLGLLTASGSIGMLFPPALPIILYSVVAAVPINKMFIAGLLPGATLVFMFSAFAVFTFYRNKGTATPFNIKEIRQAFYIAKWDLLLPTTILVSIFSGFATVVESSALAVLAAVILECVIHRTMDLKRLLCAIVRCSIITGGIMITLGLAYGLTSYLVDAQIPTTILQWMQKHFTTQAGFLMMLNVFLILVGSIMNIFSAIAVVAPIIVPIALAYHIHPIHLGIIFLLNLEIGYLTPPAGLNLFYSSYSFGLPINQISRSVIPFQLISLLVLILVTYLPELSLWFKH